ncbi:hypothetical protein Tco_0156584 [Tanacetum coccineum]
MIETGISCLATILFRYNLALTWITFFTSCPCLYSRLPMRVFKSSITDGGTGNPGAGRVKDCPSAAVVDEPLPHKYRDGGTAGIGGGVTGAINHSSFTSLDSTSYSILRVVDHFFLLKSNRRNTWLCPPPYQSLERSPAPQYDYHRFSQSRQLTGPNHRLVCLSSQLSCKGTSASIHPVVICVRELPPHNLVAVLEREEIVSGMDAAPVSFHRKVEHTSLDEKGSP